MFLLISVFVGCDSWMVWHMQLLIIFCRPCQLFFADGLWFTIMPFDSHKDRKIENMRIHNDFSQRRRNNGNFGNWLIVNTDETKNQVYI